MDIEPYTPPRRSDKTALDAAVKHCHEQGMSQNGTARELSVSRWQVRVASQRLGITWTDNRSAAAVRAAAAHARNDRVELLERWQSVAHDQLDSAELYGTLDDQQRSIVMAGIATDKAVALAKLAAIEPSDYGPHEASSKLAELMQSVREAAIVQGDDLNVND